MTRQVVVFGAGGHARVVLEIIKMRGEYDVVGLLDRGLANSTKLDGVPVIGTDEILPKLRAQGVAHYIIAVGSVGQSSPRRRLFELAAAQQMEAINAVHLHSVVSPLAKLGRGLAVMAGAVINAGATVGDNVIINTGAIVEHDCVVGDHAHISTGARLCGGVKVGEETHVGAGAIVRQGLVIGADAVVAAGAVVIKNVPKGVTVVGVPAREWVANAENARG